MKKYFELDKLQQNSLIHQRRIQDEGLSCFATKDYECIRANTSRNKFDFIRSNFAIDSDKILHNIFYNRYSDKTQVFSFYLNDDITRRSLHVQLVSRIARTIGKALNLNLDLIEAISLGHDIGHTPFGHKGEIFLNNKYKKNTGLSFKHNVHSVRVLQKITNSNLSIQTLDGILYHNGDKDFRKYEPHKKYVFSELEEEIRKCCEDDIYLKSKRPFTLEGCVVRISDMIAYLGRDRQDAQRVDIIGNDFKHDGILGNDNKDIINKMVYNIVKNSMGKNYIKIDDEVLEDFLKLREENTEIIYNNPKIEEVYNKTIK
ncbi:MAG: HD domain-containing protein, partial [Clostridioides sp.]|nr:HD domain-containing protein [Clostridioides sp.]